MIGQRLSPIMVTRRGDGFGVVVAGAGRSFRIPSRTNRPAPVLAPSINYLAQVLSAFKAVSADAFVEWAAPTTFMLPPATGWASTIEHFIVAVS